MKKVLVCLLGICMLLGCFSMSFAESGRDYLAEFIEMDLEDLIPIYEKLGTIINEKKLENATLTVVPLECELAVSKTTKLSLSCDGREITPKTAITYESSDETIAKVKNGQVTAVSPGNAEIKSIVTFEDGAVLEAVSKVAVYQPVTGIAVPKTESVFAGQEKSIKDLITISPENATYQGLMFSVDDESVATIDDNGTIKGIKGGTVNITITSTEQTDQPKSAKCVVSVNESVTSIKLNESSFKVGKQKTYKLTAEVLPESATDKSVNWISSDEKVAKVSQNGVVTGVGSGSAIISCKAADGSNVEAEANVKVIIPVNSIKISQKEIILMKNHSALVECTVSPADASDKEVKWVSADPSVFKVSSNGVVTANSTGKAKVIAVAGDGSGISESVIVYVEPSVPISVDVLRWETEWGVKTGRMWIEATNLCNRATIVDFEYIIVCKSAYTGEISLTQARFGKKLQAGKSASGKKPRYMVSGFSTASEVTIKVTSVTFSDGTVYDIPPEEQVENTFTM